MYGLKRIILIDSLFPNKAAPIDVEDHASINGTNGAGKTSIEKLLPFFYGAEPGQLENQSGGRSSFVQWYLPRQSSIIVFEYIRESGHCCAVAYRHPTGTKPAYRFLHSEFDIDYFSRMDGDIQLFCNNAELPQKWKEQGIEYSQQLEIVTDYRAVIQRDKKLINRSGTSKSKINSLASRYCLGSAKSSMQHMEKVVGAILGRHGSMDKIKLMLASIMEEEGIVMPSVSPHKANLHIADEISILRDFKNNNAAFSKIINQHAQYCSAQMRQQQIAATLISEDLNLKDRVDGTDKKLLAKNNTSIQIKSEWEVLQESIIEERTEVTSWLKDSQRKRESLQQQYDDYEQKELAKKEAAYNNLGQLRIQFELARQRYIDLTSSVEDVKTGFDEKTNNQHRLYERTLERIDQQILVVENRLTNARDERDTALKRHERASANALNDLQSKFQEERNAIYHKYVEADVEAKNLGRTQGDNDLIAKMEHVIEGHESDIEKAELHVLRCEKLYTTAKKSRDDAEGIRRNADNEVFRQKESLEQVRKLLYPDDGSFLSVLRRESPAWGETVGRVVHPDILKRKDLNPVLENSSNTLFGWNIQLDNVGEKEYALSEEKLRQKFQAGEESVKIAIDALLQKEKLAGKAQAEYSKKENEYAISKRDLVASKDDYKISTEGLKKIKYEIDETVTTRRMKARDKAALLKVELDKKDKLMAKQIEEQRTLFDEQRSEIQGQWDLSVSALEDELNNNLKSKNDAKEIHKDSLKKILSDFKQACSDKGIDASVIEKALDERQRYNDLIAEVEGTRSLLERYQAWLKDEWSQLEIIVKNTAEYQNKLVSINDNYRQQSDKYKSEKNIIAEERRQLDSERTKLASTRSEIKELLPQLGSPGVEIIDAPIEAVLSEATSLIGKMGALRKEIISEARRVDTLIGKRSGTQLSTIWDRRCDEWALSIGADRQDEKLLLNTPQILSDLIKQDIPDLENTLIQLLVNISNELNNFYSGLEDIQKRIGMHASKISHSIREHQKIDELKDISISMESKIEEEEYFSSLQKFNESWVGWNEDDEMLLPNEEFLSRVTDALREIRNARLSYDLKSLFTFTIHLTENGRKVTIRNDADLANASSAGLSYLALCAIFVGISRQLCNDLTVKLHWPIDELGIIAPENIPKLFRMLNESGIVMVGGFPSSDPEILKHFAHQHHIDRRHGVRVMSVDAVDYMALKKKKDAVKEVSDV